MNYEAEISRLIQFLFNSIKGNNENISEAEKELMNLCSPDQDIFLIVGKVLFSNIFNPANEYKFRLFSVIILNRFNILRNSDIISEILNQIFRCVDLNQQIPLLKSLCSMVGSVMPPNFVENLLKLPPSYSNLLLIYYYLHSHQEKLEETYQAMNPIFQYIIHFQLFNPSKCPIEIATIASGILSLIRINDINSYDSLIISIFSNIPGELEYLPILCELVEKFDSTKDCEEKFSICLRKLNQLSMIESYPFELKDILDNDVTIELLAGYFIRYIDFNNETPDDEEEEETRLGASQIFQIGIRFCMIQNYVKERWLNDIDSFFIEIGYKNDDDDFIRCNVFSLITNSLNFQTFYEYSMNFMKENMENLELVSKIEEAYYYIIFSYFEEGIDEKVDILPPVNPNDVILCGEYIRCITSIGTILPEEQYLQILSPTTHYIMKILFAQGLEDSLSKEHPFPEILIFKTIESLIQLIDLFQTNVDVELFELIGNLVSYVHMNANDFAQIIILLKNLWVKYNNFINRIYSINSIICILLDQKFNDEGIKSISIILDIFLPILVQVFTVDELKKQALLLLHVIVKQLPYNGVDCVRDEHKNTLIVIYYKYIIPLTESILNGNVEYFVNPFYSICAFYCRIGFFNPLFLQMILISIDIYIHLRNSFSEMASYFLSFVFEYLLIQTNENIQKVDIINKIIAYMGTSNENDINKCDKDKYLLLILSLFCTQNPMMAIPLFDSVPNFYDVVFHFISANFEDFTCIEEIYIVAYMCILCIKHVPSLDNQEIKNLILDKVFNYPYNSNDTCTFFDRDDPFISNHFLIGISKEKFCALFNELLKEI